MSGAVDLRPFLAEAGVLDRITLVVNDGWAAGQATSLAVAIAAADLAGHEAVVVAWAISPGWCRKRGDGSPPPIRGRDRGPRPTADGVATRCGWGRSIWPDLPTEGDEETPRAAPGRPDLVVEVGCPGEPDDVDTLEDLERWS